jgi:UDP-N-acetylglucosamine 4,6-dehydratase/5-epimerase
MQTVLIFGGTGSLGSQLTSDLLKLHYNVIVVSRGEHKQFLLANKHWQEVKTGQLKLMIGDVRNLPAIYPRVDYVINAAAMKHVGICQHNPHEAFTVNVLCNQEVINYCLHNDIKRAIYVGTDKAVHPINTYGTTKLIAERDWNEANKKEQGCFTIVRLGNIFGSSGSVVELYANNKSNKYSLSSVDSWRYFVPIKTASQMITDTLQLPFMMPPVVFKDYKKMKIIDLIHAFNPNAKIEIVGLREGEKLYEEFEKEIKSDYFTLDEIRELIEEYKAGI